MNSLSTNVVNEDTPHNSQSTCMIRDSNSTPTLTVSVAVSPKKSKGVKRNQFGQCKTPRYDPRPKPPLPPAKRRKRTPVRSSQRLKSKNDAAQKVNA